MGVEQRVSKKLKPLTIFLSDDELVNFKSHFDEFLNMNCDDKIKEQQEEIERLNDALKEYDRGTYCKLINENRKLNNIINELEKGLKDNIDMCDGFIDTATSDLQELGARQNGKVYYQTLLLENKIALKIYQNELNKVQELKGSDKE